MDNKISKEKIKILHVIGTLQIGGAENIAMNCFRFIDRDKYSVDYLVYDNENSPYTKEVIELGGRVIRKNVLHNRVYLQKVLMDVMKDYGPYDIVHSHLMFHNGYVMRAAKRCNIKKRISMAHSTSDGRCKLSILSFIYRTYMRSIIRRNATQYLACGKKSGEYLYGKKFFAKKGSIIKNRIDVKKFAYNKEMQVSLRKQLNMDNEVVFLIVGHLIPLKNHLFAFQVFKAIKNEIPKSKIIVLGDGDEKNKLEEWVAQNNLNTDIIFCGNVKNVNEYMIAADFLFMPSLYEGFPVTLVEAQSAGLMCFVSDHITKEIKLTNLVRFISIDEGIDPWVREIKRCLHYTRENKIDAIINQNYDLSDLGDELERLYQI